MAQPVEAAQLEQPLARTIYNIRASAHARLQPSKVRIAQRHIITDIARAVAMRAIRIAKRGLSRV